MDKPNTSGFLNQLDDELNKNKMSKKQVGAESNGQQFDKSGKTLVGRYSDGTTPPEGKKAYGVAQIQIGTARDVARKHGIAWDQNKLMTDAAYNQQLGDLHMADLRKTYGGNEALAVAAYHSGSGTVNQAIKKYGVENFIKGLGPHGQKYVAKITGNYPEYGAGGAAGFRPERVAPLQATAAEKAAMGVPTQYEIVDPFKAGPEIKNRTIVEDERSQDRDAWLTGAIVELKNRQIDREQVQKDAADRRGKAIELAQQSNEETLPEAQRLFAQMKATQDRRQELRNMNPLVRFFKSIGDRNYNEATIDAEEQNIREDLGTLLDTNDAIHKLTNQSVTDIDNETANALGGHDLQDQFFNQNATLYGMSIDSASKLLSNATGAVSEQSRLDAAQDQVIQRTLAGMSEGMLNEAVAQSSATGSAVVNGIPIPRGMLEDAAQRALGQRISIEGQQIGLQMGKLNFANAMEDQLVNSLSDSELDAAMASGGKHKNTTIAMGKLATAKEQRNAVAASRNESLIQNEAGQALLSLNEQIRVETNALPKISQHLMGSVPAVVRQQEAYVVAELNQIGELLQKANAQGTGKQMAAQLLPRMAALRERHEKIVDQIATDWSGGNKQLKPLAKAFLSGNPLSSQEGTVGLIQIARNGLPAGVNMTPEARKMIEEAGSIVRANDALPKDRRVSDVELARKIGMQIGAQRNDLMLNNVIRQMPKWAKQVVGPDGKAHPFSKVSQADFDTALRLGDATGLEQVAKRYGVTSKILDDTLRAGWANGQANFKAIATQGGLEFSEKSFNKIARQVTSAQMTESMNYLDVNLANLGFRPSAALADLLKNPKILATINSISTTSHQSSFGDFVVHSSAGPGFPEVFTSYADSAGVAANVTRANAMANARTEAETLKNPVKRAAFIAGAIEGLNPEEEKILLRQIDKILTSTPAPVVGNINTFYGGPSHHQLQNEVVDGFIISGKFDDPGAEAIRKRAAKDWLSISRGVDRGFSRITGE